MRWNVVPGLYIFTNLSEKKNYGSSKHVKTNHLCKWYTETE